MNQKIELLENARSIANITLLHECDTWILQALRLGEASDNVDNTICELLSKALHQIPKMAMVECLLHDHYDPGLLSSIENVITSKFKFKKFCDKYIFSLSLENIPRQDWETQASIFTYDNLEVLGFDYFTELFTAIQSDSADPYATDAAFDPARELMSYKEPSRYIPRFWQIAFLNGEPVGMILPGHIEEEGTVQFIGVLPSFRKKCYGLILHRKALLMLKEYGLSKYIGSAGSKNLSMVKIFERNGCSKDFVQYIYRRYGKTIMNNEP